MASDDRVPSTPEDTLHATPQPAAPLKKTGNTVSRATEFLHENSKIRLFRSHYLKYRRYYVLELQSMFDSLVALYTTVFKQYYHRFKRMAETFAVGTSSSSSSSSPWKNIAVNYVSAWFLDLYVSNREAVMKLSSLAFNEHYFHQRVYISDVYDDYLILLNAAIRPTHLQLIPEDSLAIPVFAQTEKKDGAYQQPNWSNPNPFGITGFSFNDDFFYSTIECIKAEKTWKTSPLTTNTLGTPAWLFDWHNESVCAWFPADSNFTMDDVTVAYILGVACTPNLGPIEYDDWQYFPGGIPVSDPIPSSYRWQTHRHSYGGFEVLDIDNQPGYKVPVFKVATAEEIAQEAKRKKSTTSTLALSSGSEPQVQAGDVEYVSTEVKAPRFRLKIWLYHSQVIGSIDPHTRTGSHRIISFQ